MTILPVLWSVLTASPEDATSGDQRAAEVKAARAICEQLDPEACRP